VSLRLPIVLKIILLHRGKVNIVVDAVAQQGSVDSVTYATDAAPGGGQYTHAGSGDVTLKVAVSGLFDPHHGDSGPGHTDYYVLVEAQPGWECARTTARNW
jgi:hypothetical protein